MAALRNLLTDVAGIRVGNAHDARIATGVSVVLPPPGSIAAVDVRGGGPGTRETDALALTGSVDEVHGLVLSGGSAFGLAAATGAQSWLAARGIGFNVRGAVIPIVPQAILFDLLNGGDKRWGPSPPYERLALEACDAAAAEFALGSAGAGFAAIRLYTQDIMVENNAIYLARGYVETHRATEHGLNRVYMEKRL